MIFASAKSEGDSMRGVVSFFKGKALVAEGKLVEAVTAFEKSPNMENHGVAAG